MEVLKQRGILALCSMGFLYSLLMYQLSYGDMKLMKNKEPKPAVTNERYQEVLKRELLNAKKYEHIDVNQSVFNRLLVNEVITEKEALRFKPCRDSKLAASSKFSTLQIIGPAGKVYGIGEKIYVLATLFDSYGRRKRIGGDHLRAKITNKMLNASAPGVVYDNRNGSYTLVFEALWIGTSKISATIAYTREAITTMYRLTLKVVSLRDIMAKYKSKDIEEAAVCHPDIEHLLTRAGYKEACNFTSLNSHLPWYCGKPKNPNLKCTDWKFNKNRVPPLPAFLNPCEKELLAFRAHKVFTKTIFVTVRESAASAKGEKVVQYIKPSTSCSKYNTTKLWHRQYTTGFVFNGKWRLRHCKGYSLVNLQECLRNKKLYILGDSTTRHWYENIMKRFNCVLYTEKWTDPKWKKPSGCKVEQNNFTAIMATHCQPFYISSQWRDPKFSLTSISKRLESIGTNEDAIILIHMYLHMITFNPTYFRNKMAAIRLNVGKLLKRNKKVKIFIKMPHTFNTIGLDGRINDLFSYVFTRIVKETFLGLHDRVVALDQKDATIAFSSVPQHPNTLIVTSMVDQMFSYICE